MKRATNVHLVSQKKPIRIVAYFDFMCPWSYLTRTRVMHALKQTHAEAHIEWMPFELYEGNFDHKVERKSIIGHESLNKVYADLHVLATRDNIIIRHPRYEGSSRRALTGFLYARRKGVGEKYLDVLFEQTFEHTNDISSLTLLSRVAVKMGFDVSAFMHFIENPANQSHVHALTLQAKQHGIKGLPTYIVDGMTIQGALPTSEWIKLFVSLQTKPVPMMRAVEKVAVSKKKKKMKVEKKTKKKVKVHSKKAQKGKRR